MLILDFVLILLLGLNISIAICRFWKLDIAVRIFTGILGLSLITQTLGTAALLYPVNYKLAYRISSHIELLLFCLYLNYSVPSLQRRQFGWRLALITFFVGLGFEYLSPADSFGSLFLTFEGLVIIACSVYATYKLATRFAMYKVSRKVGKLVVLGNIHFWLWACMGILWCTTVVALGLFDHVNKIQHPLQEHLWAIIWCADIISLVGMLLAFSLVPKAALAQEDISAEPA